MEWLNIHTATLDSEAASGADHGAAQGHLVVPGRFREQGDRGGLRAFAGNVRATEPLTEKEVREFAEKARRWMDAKHNLHAPPIDACPVGLPGA